MRTPIIAANWKMHKTTHEAEEFLSKFLLSKTLSKKVEVIICPPFTSLQLASEKLRGTNIALGAQNMYPEEKGAFTGEISPLMLKDLNCRYVILGHSERRHIFHETNELVNRKIKAALKNQLIPILCVGETLTEKKAGQTEAICQQQILRSLAGLPEEEVSGIVIAYEPVWAIGTGVNATADDAEKTISYIRSVLKEAFSEKAGQDVRILYGGSVNPENIHYFMEQNNIDGALVGGASLESESFLQIIEGASNKEEDDGL